MTFINQIATTSNHAFVRSRGCLAHLLCEWSIQAFNLATLCNSVATPCKIRQSSLVCQHGEILHMYCVVCVLIVLCAWQSTPKIQTWETGDCNPGTSIALLVSQRTWNICDRTVQTSKLCLMNILFVFFIRCKQHISLSQRCWAHTPCRRDRTGQASRLSLINILFVSLLRCK